MALSDERRRREADTIVHDLAHSASDEAAAACLRGALEDGHERVLVPRLHAYIVARDAEIESLCERHYSEFLGSARAPRARARARSPRVPRSARSRNPARPSHPSARYLVRVA